ncbi:MAG: decarboxylating NADP(+)-dependent phosphogluconate dehydrogenase [Calditrichaeota bacterium]|nr:MAG: phosphogluconate dehydrogenase (NADP(+)-dependent, decarboxylating) [Calditrichota bacterium]MBL1204736.1 decarboxylating NADP(+)-dependent phosphogluconate dehydrogenase [Calditrichota bacterium]NOG44564.1 decarboxylating NADP(+)-dependent phosphogluconate dehydrogenase [Calditrichota bacterium]
MKYNIGVIGLGVMGQNLALNIERNKFSVAGFDLDEEKRSAAKDKFNGKVMQVCLDLNEFVSALESPKRILMMVPAGNPVDAVISDLKPYLNKNDLLIDGGNTHFPDTERRWKELKKDGISYIGTGVSGGEKGALWGPSIMPGGDPDAWPLVKPILQAIAAKTDEGESCAEWVGEGGAGHFVKMVHNGIEYADMQMICEAYHLMDQSLGMSSDEMHKTFAEWNAGELNSYLIEITGDILAKKDEDSGKPMVDVILDTAGQKGTGKWTSIAALDLGIPVQTIAEAVFARTLSAIKEERVKASKKLNGPDHLYDGDRTEFVEMIRKALFASKICSYAQGFQLMRAADEEYGWNLNFGNIALLWRAGCIIRAQFLDNIKSAFENDINLANLLLDDYFKSVIDATQGAWRKVISKATELGIPVPAFSSALAYYDSYRCERLPANLLQAQRDYFGAHTYERVDKPRGEFFHTQWI